MKKKSLIDNIVGISKKIKDLSYTIEINKDNKTANVKLCKTLIWEELESISDYCKLHEINWEINAIENGLLIKIWEEND